MRVSAQEVYIVCKGYQARVKKFQEADHENDPRASNRVPLKMEAVREKVAGYLQENGIYKMRRADILEHMQGRLADSRLPTLNEIGTTLRGDF